MDYKKKYLKYKKKYIEFTKKIGGTKRERDKSPIHRQVIGNMIYGEGITYEGMLMNGRRHGKGFMTYEEGITYDGQWSDDNRHGYGKQISKMSIYEGQWKNDESDGKGIIRFLEDNTIYNGDFKKGKITGKGIMTSKNGQEVYEGDWLNAEKHGNGKLTLYNSNKEATHSYEGEWEHNKRHGEGIYHDNQRKTIYQGQWNNNLRHGEGTISSGKNIYQGQWEDNKRSGEGIMEYEDESIYKGKWKDDMRNGTGEITYDDKAIYNGEWKNNERHGKGRFINPSKQVIYTALWVNDIMSGPGTVELRDEEHFKITFLETTFENHTYADQPVKITTQKTNDNNIEVLDGRSDPQEPGVIDSQGNKKGKFKAYKVPIMDYFYVFFEDGVQNHERTQGPFNMTPQPINRAHYSRVPEDREGTKLNFD